MTFSILSAAFVVAVLYFGVWFGARFNPFNVAPAKPKKKCPTVEPVTFYRDGNTGRFVRRENCHE